MSENTFEMDRLNKGKRTDQPETPNEKLYDDLQTEELNAD